MRPDPLTAEGDENVELTVVMPCLNEADDRGDVAFRKAIGFLAESGISGEVLVADKRQHGRQPAAGHRRRRARVVPISDKGLRQRPDGRDPGRPRGKYVDHGRRPTTATISPTLMPFVNELRKGADLVDGQTGSGAASRPRRDAAAAQVPGQPGAQLRRPAVSSAARSVTSTAGPARLQPGQRDGAEPCRRPGWSFASEMVVKGDPWPAST